VVVQPRMAVSKPATLVDLARLAASDSADSREKTVCCRGIHQFSLPPHLRQADSYGIGWDEPLSDVDVLPSRSLEGHPVVAAVGLNRIGPAAAAGLSDARLVLRLRAIAGEVLERLLPRADRCW